MADSIQLGIRITADGKGAEGTINSLNRTIEKVGDSSRKASASLGGIEKATQGLSSAASTAGRALASIGVAISVRELSRIADTYTNLSSRLKLVSGNQSEFAKSMQDVSSIANKYQVELSAVGQAYSKIAPVVAGMGKSQRDMTAVISSLSAAMKVSGTEAGRMSEVLRQFSQAVSGPTVQMEEMNTIIDDASALWQGLQRQFPGLIQQYGSLKEAIAKGAISSQDLINATIQLRAEFEAQAASMQTTVSGAMQVLNNEFTKYIGQADQSTGASAEFASTLLLISNNLNEILDPLATVVSTVAKVEIGGWLTLVETLKEAKVQLKEMAGLKDAGGAIDPEVAKLMRYGSGQASIAEIAGPPPQAQEAQKQYFDGIKKGAAESVFAMTKLSEKQREVAQIVLDTAKAQKVDPAFALAIAQQESGFNQLAKSAVGARGVMQLMPGTAKQLGVNFNDLNDNIKGGVMYLAQQEKQFKSLRLAAAAYNAGPGNVQKFGGVPPFKETQNYVVSVGALYEKWQKVLGVQGESFTSAKDQADELSTAFNRLKTHQDDQVKKAEEYAKVQVEQIKTRLAAMDQERQAAADVAAQELAGAKTYQQKADIIEAAQQKAAAYNAEALDMVRAEFDAQEAVIKARQAALANELAQADQYNVTIDDQFKLKQALRAADNDLAILAQNRAQAEIAASGKANEFAQKAISLKQNEATAISGIIDAYQRQVEILDKLTAAKEAGATADQLAFLGDVYQTTGSLPDIISADQIARMEQYITSTKALKDAVDELTGAQKKNEEQSVKESQLRENAFWDQLIGRAQEYANVWSQIGENSNNAFGTMLVASNRFLKNMVQIHEAYKEFKAATKDSTALKWAEGFAQAQNAINLVAQSLITVRDQYEKGSKEYKKYDQIAAGVAVAAKVAAIAEGILAVVHQMSSGDPYTAIPRALAVAAMVASMGIQTGASGSGGISAEGEKRQKTQGTGTVFGDAAAQSNSIANSLEIIKQNSSNDLNYSAAMLRSLENLSNSILALANQVTSIVMPSIDAAIQASGMQFGKQNISLFSGFNKQLTDSGIGWFEASLSRILKGDFTAKMYADITKSFEVMGSALSESTKTYVRDAGSEVSNQITMIFRDMVKAMQDGASAFGKSGDQVLTALKGFKVGMEQISLKDMTMEEQTAALNAVLSKINDQMASRLNKALDLDLGPFRKAGEGMAETYFRVGSAINSARGAMEQLGLTVSEDFYKTLNATQAQGDVAAEIAKKTLVTQMSLSDGVKEYVMQLDGSVEDVVDATKKLIKASQDMRTAGFNEGDLNRTMINAAGGLDAFNSAMESFNENFLSEADRYSGDVRNLTEQFGRLGYALPDSKEAFAAMVAGIDTSTEAGQKLFGQMIALSDSFAKVADEAQRIKDKYADILDPFKKFSDQINQVGKDFGTLIGGLTGDSKGRISTIENAAAKLRGTLTGNRSGLSKELADQQAIIKSNRDAIIGYQERLDKELAKKPKNQNKALIKKLESYIQQAESSINGLLSMSADVNDRIAAINQQIAQVDAQEGIDKIAEWDRLAREKQAIIDDAVTSMGATLEDVFSQIVQTVQASQQRLQSVVAVQKSLASQLAQLQGPGAVFDLANTDRNNAFGAIDNYIIGLQGGGGRRDVETEVGLLNDAQAAVMARYNAEIAAIQEAEREYIAAETDRLNASLQLQIDAINAATEAAINAESDRLNEAIKVQQKIDQQAQKSLQNQFDAENKLTQKQFDAEQKLLQKQFDAEQKALQKAHDAQLEALQDELDAANKLSEAIKGVAEYAQSLKLSANATLSPEARLAEAQRQYQSLVGQAQGGDADAMGKLAGASDAYLEAAKQYYGSSTNYQDIFDGVQKAMESIGGMSAPDPDSIQSRIDLLREAQAEEMDKLREAQADKMDELRESQADRLDAIREIQSDQLDALREQQQARLDAMRKASQDVQDGIRKAAQDQIEAAQKATQQSIADLSDPNKNAAMKAARESAETELRKLQELAELTRIEAQKQADDAKAKAEEMAKAALDLANAQLAKLDENAKINAAQLAALNSILINAGLAPIPGYAKGGLAQPGLAIVGEQGPELVRFNRPGQVYTADQTKTMMGSDAETKQILRDIQTETRAGVTVQSQALPLVIKELAELKSEFAQMKRNQKLAVTA